MRTLALLVGLTVAPCSSQASAADGPDAKDAVPDVGWLNGRLENPRNWHFAEVLTYAPGGVGDIFMVDIPYFRMGRGRNATLAGLLKNFPHAVDSSLSVDAGFSVIPLLTSRSPFSVVIPVTLAGRYDLVTVFDRTVELDTRVGGVLLFQGARYWQAKLDLGASLRLPLDLSSGFGLLVGLDLYVISGTIALPEVGFTF
jgi:hypothetical protein